MGKRRGDIIDINCDSEEDWTRLKTQEGIMVVDIYTKWAGPCEIMKPVINKIKVKVKKFTVHILCQKY